MKKIKVRGLYSTALTQFLISKGYAISEPSDATKKRFELKEVEGADIQIYDSEDKDGIIVYGEDCDDLVNEFRKEFMDIAIRKKETGSIHAGKVERISKGEAIIDLGDAEGILSTRNVDFIKLDAKILVQVKGRTQNKFILSDQLRLFGESVILIKNGFDKVSKYTKDPDEKQRLIDISEKLKLEGWGILWKTLAEKKEEKELIQEINQLLEQEQTINQEFKKKDKGILKKGLSMYSIDFGLLAKIKLDAIRKQVTPTLQSHHLLKSSKFGQLVDLGEQFLNQVSEQDIQKRISEVLKSLGPKKGHYYYIRHKKISGKVIIMKGKVFKVDDNIILKREFSPGGTYDGLEIPKLEGDYSITTITPGKWWIKHEYHDKKNNLKGRYYSINTPIEVFPKIAKYVDLEVDVIQIGDGEKKIVDQEYLEHAYKNQKIPEALYKKALEVAEVIKNEKH
ncbi:MAG: DUF402 domain-containing protein [Nanoarchaeota archaeon]|nr:DUF402 domain-containing protein [Nanoarchaeota archaeon]